MPAEHVTKKKSKVAPKYQQEKIKLQMYSFFWTTEHTLKALIFLSTEYSLYFKKIQKDTIVTTMWCILGNRNNKGSHVLKQTNALSKSNFMEFL